MIVWKRREVLNGMPGLLNVDSLVKGNCTAGVQFSHESGTKCCGVELGSLSVLQESWGRPGSSHSRAVTPDMMTMDQREASNCLTLEAKQTI